MASKESSVLVRMRLVGAAAMARDAKVAGKAIGDLERPARRSGAAMGAMERPASRAERAMGLMTRAQGVATSAMSGLESGARSLASGLSSIERRAKIAGLVVAGLATASGIAGVKFNAQFQSLRTSFRTLLGDADKAADFVETLRDVSMGTPFRLSDVSDYARGLLGVRMEAEKIPKVLRAAGAATLATGGDENTYRRISDILGAIQAKGILGRVEITRLAQAGVPVDKILAQNLGLTSEQLANVRKEGIKADDAIDAIVKGWETEYGTAFEDAGKDWNVQLMDARKNLEQIQRLAAAPLFGWLNETAAPWFIGQMNKVIRVLNTADVSMGRKMQVILNKMVLPGLARGGAGLLGMLGIDVRPGEVMRAMRGGIGAVRSAISTVVGAVQGVLANMPAIVEVVRGVITDVIDALKPAMPFVQNVLMPLLIGIGKGVLSSVVLAFKILIPIVRTVAQVLGWLGEKAKPLRPVIEGIGLVIGFLFAAPILGGIARLGKAFATAGGLVGKAGNLIARSAKLAAIPVRILGRIFQGVVRAIRFFAPAGVAVGRAVARLYQRFVWFIGFMRGVPGMIGRFAVNMASNFVRGAARLPIAAGRVATSAVQALGRVLGSLPRKAWEWMSGFAKGLGADRILKAVGNAALNIGKAIIDSIVKFIRSAPGAVAAAVVSVIPGPLRGMFSGGGGTYNVSDPSSAGPMIPRRARGGMLRGLGVVGEEGPEIANFSSATRIHSTRESKRMLGQVAGLGSLLPLEITVNTVTPDGRLVHRQVVREERRLVEAR